MGGLVSCWRDVTFGEARCGFCCWSAAGYRGMDTTGEAPPLRCAAFQWHQGHNRRMMHRCNRGIAHLHVCLRVSVSIVGQCVALSVPRDRSDRRSACGLL